MKRLVIIGYLSLMSITTGICSDSLIGSICKLKKGSEVIPDFATDESYQTKVQILVSVTGESKFVPNVAGKPSEYIMIRFLDKIFYVHAEDLHRISEEEIFSPLSTE
jgi:hypothetical protein